MANSSRTRTDLAPAGALAGSYVALSAATLIAVIAFSVSVPRLATPEAWGHAVIVAVLAVLLPLRLRAARHGSRTGLNAAFVIALVLVAINGVEAALPGVFPGWMRIEMMLVALIMLGLSIVLARARRR